MTSAAFEIDVRGRAGTFALEASFVGEAGTTLLVGPNGSGKSTLLTMIAGGLRPSEGAIRVGGRTLFDAGQGVDVPPEGRRLGYVPQGYGLFPHLTALENVAFGLVGRVPPDEVRDRAHVVLRDLGGGDVAARRPRELSGGEQQRVALARALAIEPDALLLDEPVAALDATARREVRAFLVERVAALACPTLVVTHSLRDIEAFDARVVVLEGGRVVQAGAVDDVRAAPASDFVAELFGPAR